MTRIVLATGNLGKVTEFKSLLQDEALAFMPQKALGVEAAEETATNAAAIYHLSFTVMFSHSFDAKGRSWSELR